MRIGIDARQLSQWKGGGSVYVENLVRTLEQIDTESRYYLYSNREFALPFENLRWTKRVDSSFWFVPGSLWLLTAARSMAIEDRLDIFWGPSQALPLRLPSRMGKVLTIYDLVWRLYPETMPLYTLATHRLFYKRWVRTADRVIAISASTAHDLETLLAIPSAKIQVVHLGVRSDYRVRDPQASAQHVARKFGVSENYIFAVGTIQPRKNLKILVKAASTLLKNGAFDSQLVIAGASGWKTSEIYATVQRCGLTPQEVKFLGYVPDEDLPSMYSGARLFVFPSLYEGFGLPLVEAMASGVPIVASDAPPVPEIVEDAAILVRPESAEAFAHAIGRVLADHELRQRLIERGLRRASHFRWETAAKELLQVFQEVRRNLRPCY
jgi:glycosyltransferase involved in cell wall biosynthesis